MAKINRINTVLIGWGVITFAGLGTLVLAKKSVDKERLEMIKKERREKLANQ